MVVMCVFTVLCLMSGRVPNLGQAAVLGLQDRVNPGSLGVSS